MPRLVLMTYSHRHGTDIVAAAVPDTWTDGETVKAARRALEHEYGREELQEETDRYGGVDYHHSIKDGEVLDIEDTKGITHSFRINITEVR